MGAILVVNAGSSSVKFQIFEIEADGELSRRIKGQVDGIGRRPKLRATGLNGDILIDQTFNGEIIHNVPTAIERAGAWLRDELQINPIAVGHRVVHGGPEYAHPVRINQDVLTKLERCGSLAPLHQPHNLAPIRSILSHSPNIPQVACFDTAFHRSHSVLADHYAIPIRLHSEGVRRYGFHGLSYEYIAAQLSRIAPDIASQRVIVAHLGSGASMCAIRDGRSVESTMGFTALDGLPMGTRSGQIDPGVLLYLMAEKGMSLAEVQTFLYQECGLKGLSGISNDMRQLEASDDPLADFAIDYFVYRIGLFTGMLVAALQGVDAFVFTGGIGENSVRVREAIVEKLTWLGATLCPEANKTGACSISRADSRVAILMVPTDEELMIARHTFTLLSQDQKANKR